MLTDSIAAPEAAGPTLRALRIILGPYDPIEGQFVDCHVSPEALARLDPYWGIYVWGLKPAQD